MTTYAFQQNKFIFVFAGVMILAAVLYNGYQILNTKFLSDQERSGRVVSKEFVPFHQEYRWESVGGRSREVQYSIPDTWLLTVDLESTPTQVGVDKSVFEAMDIGTEVNVRYKKRRFTGTIQVTSYLGRVES